VESVNSSIQQATQTNDSLKQWLWTDSTKFCTHCAQYMATLFYLTSVINHLPLACLIYKMCLLVVTHNWKLKKTISTIFKPNTKCNTLNYNGQTLTDGKEEQKKALHCWLLSYATICVKGTCKLPDQITSLYHSLSNKDQKGLKEYLDNVFFALN
jgi:hypothetical protein